MEKSQQMVLEKLRGSFAAGKTLPVAFRLQQLKNFQRMFEERQDEILEALHKDLRKAKLEGTLYEIEVCKNEIKYLIKHFKEWAKDEPLPLNLLAILDSGYIKKEPFGIVLILGAWNYPFTLTCKPMAGAIAAGNCVVLKPSEISPHSADLMAKLFPLYLDSSCYEVVLGDVEETQKLLLNKFDYIFYTGSSPVGKIILQAAAPHLTPVTLELGGKSPCYIDETADFQLAAKRILWGKFMNLGQTCIAADYVLCSKKAENEFIKVARVVMQEWYGNDWQGCQDMPRIVNKKHFLRLKKLLETTSGKITFGGKSDENDLWIEPTIVVDVNGNDSLMEDEIFGPILPIINVNSPEEAIKFILSKPKPLALYTFAKDDSVNKKMVNQTSSGGVCINDLVWQNAWLGLPFGGVGNSGMGRYHGKYSFETFSHRRSVLNRGFGYLSEKLGEARYPPYTQQKIGFFKLILDYFETCNVTGGGAVTHIASALVGALAVFIYFYFIH